ncbi:thioredoxin family protein [Flammeovirgaceae bacterium SG7u.111]|nr:thioredoxin family protein [Flammeovirgaceae bacterium SG7u.132]WPO37981.1 thioredoxin family protein [Flammeovirgaceae bacterium SG7u.111]
MKKLLNFIVLASMLLLMGSMIGPPAVTNYEVGSHVKDFSLKNVSGKMISLSALKSSKGFIVVFLCNTCPIVKLNEHRLIELHYTYAPQGYPIIAINSNDGEKSSGDTFEKMQQHAEDMNFPFVYLHDADQAVAKQFGATRTPHVFLINKEEGKMKVVYIGAIDDSPQNGSEATKSYVANAIDRLIVGKKVRKSTTKAVGCSIKWKER